MLKGHQDDSSGDEHVHRSHTWAHHNHIRIRVCDGDGSMCWPGVDHLSQRTTARGVMMDV